MLPVNQVFSWAGHRYRLLWCSGDIAIWIEIDDDTSLPVCLPLEELERLLLDEEVQRIDDPFIQAIMREVEEGTPDWQKRERAWNMLAAHVEDPGLLDSRTRGHIVRSIMEEHGVTHQTVYRYLKRYWQRGMCKNALLPDYFKSGAKGKKRQVTGIKLGRPRVVRDGTGVNITPDIERVFRRVIETSLLKEKHLSVADAHAKSLNFIRAMYPDSPASEMPTPEQFRYFFRREYEKTSVLEKQSSAIDFAKDIRPLRSTSTAEALGPGHRYQIDATVGDLYLVSEHDRSLIVGRPVIYVVVDVFSRMVTGLYIGFEGPSWVSGMMALANSVTDKVEYCRQFGIDVGPDDWPVQGLPDVILADKGELNGTKVEPFSEAFGIRIKNASARRGDAKGVVERMFRTLQDGFKPYVPGVVEASTSRKRGGHDYRLDASLTLSDFTRYIVAAVLYHNNFRTMARYDRAESMPGDLPAVPLDIWNWGLANMTGRLRQAPEELVRINLLPHDAATLSDRGVRLFGCFYTCPEAIKAGWFHRGAGQRPEKVQVAYDPRCADHIYIRPNKSLKDYWVCDLADLSRRFRGMTFWEVWQLTRAEKKADANALMVATQEKGKLLEQLEAIVAEADASRPDRSGLTKKDLGTRIRENKQGEKHHERGRTAVKPIKKHQDKTADIVPLKGEKPDDYAFPDMGDLIFGDDGDE